MTLRTFVQWQSPGFSRTPIFGVVFKVLTERHIGMWISPFLWEDFVWLVTVIAVNKAV